MELKFAFLLIALIAVSAASALNITSATNVTSGRELYVQINGATENQTCTVYTQIGNYVLDYAQYNERRQVIDQSIAALKVNTAGNAYYNLKVDNRYPIGQEFNLTADCGSANYTKAILVKRSNSDVETSNWFYNLTSEWSIINGVLIGLLIIGAILTARLIYEIYRGVQ